MVANRKPNQEKRPVPESADVPIAEIDPTPATKVRARLIDDAVDTYADIDGKGEPFWEPAEAVHYRERGRDAYLLADGRHRLEARKRNGRTTLPCDVYRCGSRADAERLAYELAAKANAQPGMKRSEADNWAAVETMLLRPEFGAESDYRIYHLTRTYAGLVRRVREKLTHDNRLPKEARSDSPGRYKNETAHIGGGRRSDGKGGTLPATPSAGTSASTIPLPASEVIRSDDFTAGLTDDSSDEASLGCVDHSDALGETDAVVRRPLESADAGRPMAGEDNESTPTPTPASVVPKDEKGRPLPPHLIPNFEDRTWFRSITLRVNAIYREVEGKAKGPSGAGSRTQLTSARKDAEGFIGVVSSGFPYVVCPTCDGSGQNGLKGVCLVCGSKGGEPRGWLTRLRYKQLTPDQRAVCDKYETANDAGPEGPSAATPT